MLEKIKGYRRAITAFLTTAATLGTAYVATNDVGVSGAQVQQMSTIALGIISGALTLWSMLSPEQAKLPKRFSDSKNKFEENMPGERRPSEIPSMAFQILDDEDLR